MQKILLVEDNEMNRDLISRRLTRRGFEVVIAKDGAEGVEKAASEVPDLVLMDIGLPILDGYEATRLIKENRPNLPVIGLSAHAMSGDADRAREAGADDYDTKPVDFPRLLGKIQTLLERAASAPAAEAALSAEASGDDAAGPNLLVVDDSPMHREMLSSRLGALGYSFDLASDVSEAVAALRKGGYAAVLLDVTQPNVNGQPVLRYLRAQPEARDVPILLLSTIDAIPEAVEFLGDGADEFVPQPFRTQELKVRLASVLGERSAQPAASSEDRRRAEHLLKVLLPDPLIEELRENHRLPPRREDAVTVLSWDVPDLGDRMTEDLDGTAGTYQRLLVAFETLAEDHHVHTLRTAGDGVLAVAGQFTGASDPVSEVVKLASELRLRASDLVPNWLVRIGVHTGPAVVAVVGQRSCQLGVWGQPVKVSRRLRNLCRTTTVLASSEVWERCAGKAQGVQAGTAELKEGPPSAVYRIDSVQA